MCKLYIEILVFKNDMIFQIKASSSLWGCHSVVKLFFYNSWEIYGLAFEAFDSHNPNRNLAVMFFKRDGVES